MAVIGDQQTLHAAFQKLSAAFKALGAQHLVENLQAGAKPLALSRLEQKLGFPLPKVLRTLWLLHDGEKKPAHGFAAPFHLLPVAWVLNERVTTLKRVERLRVSAPPTFARQILVPALEQLERAFAEAEKDPSFQAELAGLLRDYAGRPTPLGRCPSSCTPQSRARCR